MYGMKKILYTVAKKEDGSLIEANEALKGDNYFCCVCNQKLTLRKSEKRIRRPHFAHKVLTNNCTPETALHFAFKNILYKKIESFIAKDLSLNMKWECNSCYKEHNSNMLKNIKKVKLEYNLGSCRPDIALLDANGNVIIVIEVVVSHYPEEKVLEFFKKNNIILIRFDLKGDEDLDIIRDEILKPSFIDFCFNPKCKICDNFMQDKKIIIMEGPCRECNSKIKVASIEEGEITKVFGSDGPEGFSSENIEFARSKGAFIDKRYTGYYSAKGHPLFVNICKKCNSFVFPQSIFTDYISASDCKREEYIVGYYCEECIRIENIRKNKEDKERNI